MSILPRQMICTESKKAIKYPYSMTPTRIVVHNTYNDASADAEVRYMNSNNNTVSFHFAVDNKEVVQGIPLNCNAWHAGDGARGAGNRQGIAIEICYSKSGGTRFIAAEKLAAQFIAQLLKERGWGLERVTKHQDYSGKYCPHRTLDMGWKRFLNMVERYLSDTTPTTNSDENTLKYKIGDKVYYSSCYKGKDEPVSKALLLNSSYFGGKFKSGTITEVIKTNCHNPYKLNTGDFVNDGDIRGYAPKVTYFPKYTGKSNSLVDALSSLNIDFTPDYRTKIAKANGISNYVKSAKQNTQLLNKLKQGTLIKP